MEKVKVLGVKHVDFVNDETGERIVGSQFWLGAETPDEAWNGHEVFKVWFADTNALKPQVDQLMAYQDIEVQFDRKGKKILQLRPLD